jgi:hypothetical protein
MPGETGRAGCLGVFPIGLHTHIVDNPLESVDNDVTCYAASVYFGATDAQALLYAHGGTRRIPSLISRMPSRVDHGEKP